MIVTIKEDGSFEIIASVNTEIKRTEDGKLWIIEHDPQEEEAEDEKNHLSILPETYHTS